MSDPKQPPKIEPPVTQPPKIEPPVTQPPTTIPPVTQPPVLPSASSATVALIKGTDGARHQEATLVMDEAVYTLSYSTYKDGTGSLGLNVRHLTGGRVEEDFKAYVNGNKTSMITQNGAEQHVSVRGGLAGAIDSIKKVGTNEVELGEKAGPLLALANRVFEQETPGVITAQEFRTVHQTFKSVGSGFLNGNPPMTMPPPATQPPKIEPPTPPPVTQPPATMAPTIPTGPAAPITSDLKLQIGDGTSTQLLVGKGFHLKPAGINGEPRKLDISPELQNKIDHATSGLTIKVTGGREAVKVEEYKPTPPSAAKPPERSH